MEQRRLQKEHNFCIHEGKLDDRHALILLPSGSSTTLFMKLRG